MLLPGLWPNLNFARQSAEQGNGRRFGNPGNRLSDLPFGDLQVYSDIVMVVLV